MRFYGRCHLCHLAVKIYEKVLYEAITFAICYGLDRTFAQRILPFLGDSHRTWSADEGSNF